MHFEPTELAGVVEVGLDRRTDARGWFARAWCEDEFAAAGLDAHWVQANQARNPLRGTLRGLHLQRGEHAETKFVRCIAGSVFDVAVDARLTSTSFGRWVGRVLSAFEGNGLLIPEGFAHGYLTLEDNTDLLYLTTSRYSPAAATGLRFDDSALAIAWPSEPILISEQDREWPLLSQRTDL